MEPEVEKELTAKETLVAALGGWLMELRLEGASPIGSVASLMGVLYEVVTDDVVGVGHGAARTALMMVYERSYAEPMTFSEREKAKTLLDQISQARRSVEGKPSLILPGAFDA